MFKQLLAITIFFFATAASASADTGNQYGQYGPGTPAAGLLVDKAVSRGTQTKGGIVEYVDNFAPSDSRFKANDRVYFQIKVKNTSSSTLQNVQMTDKLPEYIDAVEGPGTYDAANRTIRWDYAELKSGEERIERVVAQIKPQAQLPADKGVFCVKNQAAGQSGNIKDDDTAQFCIEKEVSQTKGGIPPKAPEAGPELGILFGALNIVGLGAGVYLKRKI